MKKILFLSFCLWMVSCNKEEAAETPKKEVQVSAINQTEAPKKGETVATIKTNMGTMKFRLFEKEIPEGVKNFTTLAKEGKYKSVPFHRVVKDFMIQGGDFTNKNGTGGHSYKGKGTTIGDEYHKDLKHVFGALSYAKTSMPNSIGSQFFVVSNKSGTHFLDHPEGGGPAAGYTVFGQLFEGTDVLTKIQSVETVRGDGGEKSKPTTEILIEDIEISTF